jgi:hypothetical protein
MNLSNINLIFLFRRLNTTWFEYTKTVTNSHVYDAHSKEFRHLLDNLQNGPISEASMTIKFILLYLIFFCFYR